jgi:NosR/NirI family transcriptional regulator, nitrous oxide reductase regulator
MANTNRLLKIFLLIAGMAVIVLSSGKIFNYSFGSKAESEKSKTVVLTDKTKFFPEIAEDFSYFEFDSIADSYHLFNSKNKEVCYLIYSSPYCDSIDGFGGNIPFAIIFNPNDKIEKLYLFEHSETPSWIEGLETDKFFETWNGLSAKEALNLQVDAVSGATLSSVAVIESVKIRLSIFTSTDAADSGSNWLNIIGLILSFLVLLFAIFSFLVPEVANRMRIFLLIASVGVLGFWQGEFLSMALLHNWLVNGMDIWAQIFLLIVLFLSVLFPLITNKSFYCQFVCPYGAAQELVGKLNKRKVVFDGNVSQVLKYLKFVYLFVTAVLIVVAVDFSIENLEPFSAFKFQFASMAVLILAIVMLFLSVFISKPWCRFFCPTGALLSLLRGKSSKSKKKNIKLSVLLNIVFAVSILVMIYVNYLDNSDKKQTETKKETVVMSTTLDVIHNRKSVRNFTDQEVTKEQLEVLLKAGMAAPSARNLQPWAFVVVTDREKLDLLAASLPYAKMLYDAQAAIIVCGDMNKAATDVDSAYWVQDCSAATQNILLAAEATGLGAVWTAAYPYQDRMGPVIDVLELPEKIIPLNVIPIGYPTGEDKPKNKWKPENIHWEKW